MFRWDDGQPGEDCLRVNIWTPGINDNRKRPVMVWLHGGGFSAGSGQELQSYDGENLSRRGDVVVVSLNHRLNTFGFLNLADFGEQISRLPATPACWTWSRRSNGCATTSRISAAIRLA
jgi:para-nitrobenzyl esterase